jgi:hypothetical protein
MKNLSPIEKLDFLLDVLAKNFDKNIKANTGVLINQSKDKLTLPEIELILSKFRKDGYSTHQLNSDTSNMQPLTAVFYFITFEGLVFHQQGGYYNKLICDAQNEKRIIRNERRLIYGTWFAGFVGAALFFWQVFIWYFPTYCAYPYMWIFQKHP